MRHRKTAVLLTVLGVVWLAPAALAGQPASAGAGHPTAPPPRACPGACQT